jgi:hypothetical protein
MDSDNLHRLLTPAQYTRLQDEARGRAVRLRDEAIAEAARACAQRVRRIGARLAAALKLHVPAPGRS